MNITKMSKSPTKFNEGVIRMVNQNRVESLENQSRGETIEAKTELINLT